MNAGAGADLAIRAVSLFFDFVADPVDRVLELQVASTESAIALRKDELLVLFRGDIFEVVDLLHFHTRLPGTSCSGLPQSGRRRGGSHALL